VSSFAFDVVSRFAGELMWARAAMWLVTIGLVGGVVAAIVGWLDQRRLPAAHRGRAHVHATLNLAVIGLFAASLAVRRSRLSDLVSGSPAWAIAFSAVALVVLAASSWLGNALAFSSRGPVTSAGADERAERCDRDPGLPVHPAVAAARRQQGRAGPTRRPGSSGEER
jgi:uncharacterized membrane protein